MRSRPRLPRPRLLLPLLLLVASCVLAAVPVAAREPGVGAALGAALRPLEPLSTTGILYDRVLPLARLERLDGSAGAPAVDRAGWLQAYDELLRAALAPRDPATAEVEARARAVARAGTVPLALLDRDYERVRPGAMEDGSLRVEGGRLVPVGGAPLVRSRALAVAALAPRTFRGAALTFTLDPGLCFVAEPPRAVAVDFADGRGFRPVRIGEPVTVRYAATGPRLLAARVTRADGTTGEARFAFEVAALATPPPDDTLQVTATEPFQGQYGSGAAYVYLAAGRTALVNPVLVVEGFDLDNSMGWDELYAMLNQQGLLETLRADGFDAVVLDFADATAAVEQNAMVVAELVRRVEDSIDPGTSVALVGASMGGLCTRYALAWLEANSVPHRVRTWISFDTPHGGADIPLGLQHWIDFFAGQSASAAAFRATLQSPAARQLLLHHFTEPPTAAGTPDPLRDSLLAHLAALGGWPAQPRRVAIANGSGARLDQGFAPAAQLIRYEYSSFLVAMTGNVWAVPDQVSATVFRGVLRILLSTTSETVTVSGTQPWDGAPGGWRSSLAQLDATAAPYGDIVALHPDHSFVPTVSALALPTGDPFFDVAGSSLTTPFDTVYYPAANEEHVSISAQCAAWVRQEIEQDVLAGPAGAAPSLGLLGRPNPFTAWTRLTFTLPRAATATLRVYDVDGRALRTLLSGPRAAGTHEAAWNGHDQAGNPARAGVYFLRLETDGGAETRRIVKIE